MLKLVVKCVTFTLKYAEQGPKSRKLVGPGNSRYSSGVKNSDVARYDRARNLPTSRAVGTGRPESVIRKSL